jgi:DNA-binding response OmpR family regulator
MAGRALIVEDDQDLRVVLSILLTTEGWKVSAVATLEEAEAHLDEMPELLLLDVLLAGPTDPEAKAGELLARLACRVDAPVTLLVSGCEELTTLAHRYGVAYARKPIEIDSLMLAIDLARSESRRPSLGHMRTAWISVRPPAPSLA